MNISEVKEGDVMIVHGFTCIADGREVIIHNDPKGLWVPCSVGKHFLIGQTNPDGTLVGLTLKEKKHEMSY